MSRRRDYEALRSTEVHVVLGGLLGSCYVLGDAGVPSPGRRRRRRREGEKEKRERGKVSSSLSFPFLSLPPFPPFLPTPTHSHSHPSCYDSFSYSLTLSLPLKLYASGLCSSPPPGPGLHPPSLPPVVPPVVPPAVLSCSYYSSLPPPQKRCSPTPFFSLDSASEPAPPVTPYPVNPHPYP